MGGARNYVLGYTVIDMVPGPIIRDIWVNVIPRPAVHLRSVLPLVPIASPDLANGLLRNLSAQVSEVRPLDPRPQ